MDKVETLSITTIIFFIENLQPSAVENL